jgi:hypothetical protein
MALQRVITFDNLNLFIKEEVIPQNNDNVYLKADLIELPETNVSFTKISIAPDFMLYTFKTQNLAPETVPEPFVPFLMALHRQIQELLTQDIYKLNKLFDDLTPQFKFDIEKLSTTTTQFIYIFMVQQYENVLEYASTQQNNNFFQNLQIFEIASEDIKEKEINNPIVEYKPEVTYVQNKRIESTKKVAWIVGNKAVPINHTKRIYFPSLNYRRDDPNEQLDPVVQLSLLRLTWAIESINKIKSSILYKVPSVIFLDNLEVQTRMLLTPHYYTRFNLDTLALFNNSPLYKENLEDWNFSINRNYHVKDEEQVLVEYDFSNDNNRQTILPFSYSMEVEDNLFEILFLSQPSNMMTID